MPGHLKLSAIGWAGNIFCYIVGKSFSISVVFFALQLLSKPKFSVLEKIKTIGSTYMVAAGLQPGKEGERSVTRSISCNRVEKIYEDNLDSIPSPSTLVKIEISGGKVYLK